MSRTTTLRNDAIETVTSPKSDIIIKRISTETPNELGDVFDALKLAYDAPSQVVKDDYLRRHTSRKTVSDSAGQREKTSLVTSTTAALSLMQGNLNFGGFGANLVLNKSREEMASTSKISMLYCFEAVTEIQTLDLLPLRKSHLNMSGEIQPTHMCNNVVRGRNLNAILTLELKVSGSKSVYDMKLSIKKLFNLISAGASLSKEFVKLNREFIITVQHWSASIKDRPFGSLTSIEEFDKMITAFKNKEEGYDNIGVIRSEFTYLGKLEQNLGSKTIPELDYLDIAYELKLRELLSENKALQGGLEAIQDKTNLKLAQPDRAIIYRHEDYIPKLNILVSVLDLLKELEARLSEAFTKLWLREGGHANGDSKTVVEDGERYRYAGDYPENSTVEELKKYIAISQEASSGTFIFKHNRNPNQRVHFMGDFWWYWNDEVVVSSSISETSYINVTRVSGDTFSLKNHTNSLSMWFDGTDEVGLHTDATTVQMTYLGNNQYQIHSSGRYMLGHVNNGDVWASSKGRKDIFTLEPV